MDRPFALLRDADARTRRREPTGSGGTILGASTAIKAALPYYARKNNKKARCVLAGALHVSRLAFGGRGRGADGRPDGLLARTGTRCAPVVRT